MFILGGMIRSVYGYSLKKGLFEFASTVGTVGLSVGVTTASAPSGMLWTQIIGMLLGRMEFFAVIVSTMKLVQDVRSMLGWAADKALPTTRLCRECIRKYEEKQEKLLPAWEVISSGEVPSEYRNLSDKELRMVILEHLRNDGRIPFALSADEEEISNDVFESQEKETPYMFPDRPPPEEE